MANQLNISELFFDAFGIAINPKIDVPEESKPAAKQVKSRLDQPYYASQSGKFGGREWFLPVQVGEYQLPVPLMRIEAARDIVKRKLKAIDGELMTNMGKRAYVLTIQGLCIGSNGQWPEDEVTLLHRLESEGKTLPITSVAAAIFGITHVVIDRVRVFENRGFNGVVPYQIEMTSDKDIDLIIKDV